jgi:hypothetical protein
MESNRLNDFAARYTAAWCSQNAASVASFFGANGSLKINEGAPSVGRAAITDAAQGFMTAFPDECRRSLKRALPDLTSRFGMAYGCRRAPRPELLTRFRGISHA